MAYLYLLHVSKVVVRRVHERRLWLRYGWLLHDGWLLYDGCVGVSQIAQDVIHDRPLSLSPHLYSWCYGSSSVSCVSSTTPRSRRFRSLHSQQPPINAAVTAILPTTPPTAAYIGVKSVGTLTGGCRTATTTTLVLDDSGSKLKAVVARAVALVVVTATATHALSQQAQLHFTM